MMSMSSVEFGWTGHCEGQKTGYSHLAPAFTLNPRKINRPLGRKRADAIADELGITEEMLLTRREYRNLSVRPNQDLRIHSRQRSMTAFNF